MRKNGYVGMGLWIVAASMVGFVLLVTAQMLSSKASTPLLSSGKLARSHPSMSVP
ncbi:MAG: hypothetical protein HYY13_03805 [Nitrospirae bacterium]|nr:hypothetical protein [Nitrospirota bacterium]